MLLWASKFATVKIDWSFGWASKNLLRYHLLCCWWYIYRNIKGNLYLPIVIKSKYCLNFKQRKEFSYKSFNHKRFQSTHSINFLFKIHFHYLKSVFLVWFWLFRVITRTLHKELPGCSWVSVRPPEPPSQGQRGISAAWIASPIRTPAPATQ